MRAYLYLLECTAAIFALVTGMVRWRQLPAGYQYLWVQLGIACMVELSGKLLDRLSVNNQPLFNIYLLIEMWLLIAVARSLFIDRTGKVFCLLCLALGTLAWACFFCFSPFRIFAFPLLVLECFLQSAVYLALLISLISGNEEVISLRRPEIWLILGTLIYFSGNIPLFGILTFLDRKSDTATIAFNLNIVFLCLRYVFIGAAFHLHRGSKLSPNTALS